MSRLIRVDDETYYLLKNDCTKEYRRHHPEHDKIPISLKKITYEVAKLYLKVR